MPRITPTRATRETKRVLEETHLDAVTGRVYSTWTDDEHSATQTIVHLTTDAFAGRVIETLQRELGDVFDVHEIDFDRDPAFFAVAIVRKAGAS